MKDPREYLENGEVDDWFAVYHKDEVLPAIAQAQKDAWNAALNAAADNVETEPIDWGDHEFGEQVDKQSILKLMKK